MIEKPKHIIIKKDDAVFWLDANGRWNNKHGIFRNKKIIDLFNSSIKKDKHGYFIYRVTDDYTEQVYFNYTDTALFVFDIKIGEKIILVLNTKQEILLKPDKLFITDDNLYMQDKKGKIKFVERALMHISKLIEDDGSALAIKVNNIKYKIQEI